MSFSHDFNDSDESYDFEVEEVIISWRTRTWRKAVNWFRRIHWTTWIVPIIAVLMTLTGVVLNAGIYTNTLSTALAGTTTEVGHQRDHDAYLTELSHRLIDQFEREMREISTQITKTLEENRKLYSEDAIRKLAHDEVLRRTSKVVRVDYASVFAVSFNRDAELVLHRVSEEITPGLCWPFYNSNGFLVIELPELVNINEIVYIHAATAAEPSVLRGSAPQIVEAWMSVSWGTQYAKLKTNLRLAANRLRLLQKKKTEQAMKARSEIADFLMSDKEDRARIRVESIIREDFVVEAYEILEMFCELLMARFGVIQQMKYLIEIARTAGIQFTPDPKVMREDDDEVAMAEKNLINFLNEDQIGWNVPPPSGQAPNGPPPNQPPPGFHGNNFPAAPGNFPSHPNYGGNSGGGMPANFNYPTPNQQPHQMPSNVDASFPPGPHYEPFPSTHPPSNTNYQIPAPPPQLNSHNPDVPPSNELQPKPHTTNTSVGTSKQKDNPEEHIYEVPSDDKGKVILQLLSFLGLDFEYEFPEPPTDFDEDLAKHSGGGKKRRFEFRGFDGTIQTLNQEVDCLTFFTFLKRCKQQLLQTKCQA
ncbi:IST1-like protein [Aphelenchoides besseyi]|nr:IST1-like protein [Aphelenchoides besseyi]